MDADSWEPWMKKGRLYEAMREGRYIKITYSKKEGDEWSIRLVWPKKIQSGRLHAEDVTPGKRPGPKLFIVDRITYVEILPKGWTPLDAARTAES